MKVMLCHNYYQLPGGEDQVFQDESWLLEQHGHPVIRFEKRNDEIDLMGKISVAGATIWNFRVQRELDQQIGDTQPDVVHFHNTFPLISTAGYAAAKKHRAGVVQTLHNFRLICPGGTLLRDGKICEQCVNKKFAWPAIRHACYRDSKSATTVLATHNAIHHTLGTWKKNVDVFIALTEHSRGIFVAAGLPQHKIVVKPNFVRPDPGQRSSEGDHVVFAGRLSPEKGIDVLLSAWLEHRCDVPLTIIGDGPSRELVVAAANANSNITWLGQLPFEQTLQEIRNSKMLVMPSVWYETFGRTMIEAFAAGVPVVASNLGAMKEIVTHDLNGLHFQVGSGADLAKQVTALAGDEQQRHRLGSQARQTFVELYSANTNYDLLINIYNQAKQGSLHD